METKSVFDSLIDRNPCWSIILRDKRSPYRRGTFVTELWNAENQKACITLLAISFNFNGIRTVWIKIELEIRLFKILSFVLFFNIWWQTFFIDKYQTFESLYLVFLSHMSLLRTQEIIPHFHLVSLPCIHLRALSQRWLYRQCEL